MRVTAEQYILLTPEQKDRVTEIVITDEIMPIDVYETLPSKLRGEFEEYPGEAESRGVDHRGFIKP